MSCAYHDVSMETECQPVGEHPLGYTLCSPEEQLGMGLVHNAADQLSKEILQNSGGRGHDVWERGRGEGSDMHSTYLLPSQLACSLCNYQNINSALIN